MERSQYNPDRFFNGAYDDFKLYGRALSAAEVTALAGHVAVSADQLMVSYPFDETSGFTAADSSGSARHGQAVGGLS